jgi:hypothetical protein
MSPKGLSEWARMRAERRSNRRALTGRPERHPLRAARELMQPAGERAAAQAERRAEEAMRRERDSTETADRRAAAIAAEAKRHRNLLGPGG